MSTGAKLATYTIFIRKLFLKKTLCEVNASLQMKDAESKIHIVKLFKN